MAEEQRKLLEQLMGKEALISPAQRRREVEMTNHRVCRSFLVGPCPHDLLAGTKQDLGKCPLLHLEKHKMEYEYRTKKGEQFPDIEYAHYLNLKKYINELDRTIEFAQKRLERTPEEKEKIAAVTKELDDLDTNIGLMTQEINYLIHEHQTLKATLETVRLKELCEKRETLAETARNIAENVGQVSQQKLQVCEACGAYLSRLDSDRRLADHLIGKIHLGYVQMRQAYDELNSKYKKSHI
ncbi:LUC7-domain-containing protein [Suhomyces tanzawaensis NRRL Y-17324]|uniref:LUC7-domain-containing protein n=1 Tax=Suhomyces tanzawaensis NRRL Y-17324 TaxID=984487 RepID=A0A1E4SDY1_9ASCO|nr:LUC7-domain-containing protein [Suhomyces tanzawaensis NRRL Y-17324]ODV77717.1 LUC7-domain-containing protein [Suhomyces tanzawaensis NRRL Y-17324]